MGQSCSQGGGSESWERAFFFSLGGHLSSSRFYNDDEAGDEEREEVKFRLCRAKFLCQLCGLVYADGAFWASHSGKTQGDLSRGLSGTSSVFRYFAGQFHKEMGGSVVEMNPLGVVPLGEDLNKSWKWREYQGTFVDGLVDCAGSHVLHTDTQALLTLREGRKTLVISFRGTEGSSMQDIFTSMRCRRQSWPQGPNGEDLGRVHSAMFEAWQSVEEAVLDAVRSLVASGVCKKVLCTGHSLGGGVATLCALRLRETFPDLPVEVYTFGGAVVGDLGWKRYFETQIKGCYRVINDQDIVPSLTMTGVFSHVGTLVNMNEIGLWIEQEPEDDGEGGFDEFLTDHKLGNYMRLLDYFTAITTARHKVRDFEQKIQDAWEAYVSTGGDGDGGELSPFSPISRSSRRTISIVRDSPCAPALPNTSRMAAILNEYFGIDEARAFLVEPEVLRLCSNYKVERFSYPVFVTACAHLFFGESDDDNWEAQSWARRYAEFAAYDVDNTNFLSRKEFRQMVVDMMPNEFRQPDVALKFLEEAEEQFKKMDVNLDQQISFQEYVVWHKMGGDLSVKLHQEGALASPTTDDLHTHGHVELLAQSMWRRRYKRSAALSHP